MRFVDGENSGRDLVYLEPGITRRYALEVSVFRPWKRAAPLGNLRLSIEDWNRESYTDDERDV